MSMSEYSDSEPPACPECGSDDTERSFTSFGVMTGSRGSGGRTSGGGTGCGHTGFT